MSTFAVVLLCVQACLIQMVLAQCGNAYSAGLSAIGPYASTSAFSSPAYLPIGAPASFPAYNYGIASPGYGGAGEGNLEAIGDFRVKGTTGVVGSVPIVGVINFDEYIPAAGIVSITGQCCGCGSY